MMKILMLMLIFFGISAGRDDPFTPLIVPKDSIRPYYGESSVFESAKIDFPSTARLIKKVEVTFQNLDGSIETKSVALSGRIDWQVPLLVTQILNKNQRYALSNIENKTPPPAPKNTMVKDINIPLDKNEIDAIKKAESSAKSNAESNAKKADSAPKKVDSSAKFADSKKAESNARFAESNAKKAESNAKFAESNAKKVESSAKKANSAPKKAESKKAESKIAESNKKSIKTPADSTKSHNPPKKSAKFTPYKINGKSIFIAYNGRIKRHFMMQNPYRIVMDFEINKKFYKQNRYTLNSPHFKRLKYGLHTKFLRIVLEMNGSYIYELGVREDGVQINVK